MAISINNQGRVCGIDFHAENNSLFLFTQAPVQVGIPANLEDDTPVAGGTEDNALVDAARHEVI